MARFSCTPSSTSSGVFGPLPSFLTYAEGRAHLPVLNENFGWDSDGLWLGPTSDGGEGEGEGESYPVFTNFTIPEGTSVMVEFDLVIEEFCSDAGIAFYVDGTTPEWYWDGTNPTRIAAQFNCPNPEISGINGVGTPGESNSPISGPGIYKVVVEYVPGSGVSFAYGLESEPQPLGVVNLEESLPPGNYRIGFASDNDPNDDEEFDSESDKTYIKNLTITVDPVGEGETVYTNSLTNGNSGGSTINVDTGDITFDGVKIIGAGDASGDGNGYATMELVPDSTLYNIDQYLIIDPTGPNHIHIRAGGEQDSSNAELILGAEKTNVLINDFGGRVEVHSKPSSDGDIYQNINSEPGNTLSVNTDLTYLLDSPREGTNFVIANDKYEITSWSVTEGITSIVAGDFAFDANGFYGVFREYPSNEWSFDSNGYLYGPADGYLAVQGLLGPQDDSDLEIVAPTTIVLSSQFGEYLGNSEMPGNQIATIGDLPTGATGSFVSQDGKAITVTNGIITAIDTI